MTLLSAGLVFLSLLNLASIAWSHLAHLRAKKAELLFRRLSAEKLAELGPGDVRTTFRSPDLTPPAAECPGCSCYHAPGVRHFGPPSALVSAPRPPVPPPGARVLQ